jgi:hypothetical protein
MKAMKLCVKELRAHYEELPDSAPTEADENQLLFRYRATLRLTAAS